MTQAHPTPPPPSPGKPVNKLFMFAMLIVIVTAGGFVWWLSHRDADVRDFTESFIREMDKGNLTAAKSRCVADIDADEMKRLSDRMVKEWGEIHLLDLSGIIRHPQPDGTARIDIAGQLEYDNDLRKSFTATLVQQKDGALKISSYKFE